MRKKKTTPTPTDPSAESIIDSIIGAFAKHEFGKGADVFADTVKTMFGGCTNFQEAWDRMLRENILEETTRHGQWMTSYLLSTKGEEIRLARGYENYTKSKGTTAKNERKKNRLTTWQLWGFWIPIVYSTIMTFIAVYNFNEKNAEKSHTVEMALTVDSLNKELQMAVDSIALLHRHAILPDTTILIAAPKTTADSTPPLHQDTNRK